MKRWVASRVFCLLTIVTVFPGFPVGAFAEDSSHPLPGEEVSRPMGQRMKVWSTEGPVPVSQPPEPYQQKKPPVRSLDLSVRGQRDQVRRKESSEREFSQPGAREHHLRGQNSRESE